MTHQLVQEIFQKFTNANIKQKTGVLTFELADLKVQIDNKDIIGGVLQSWFGEWLTANGFSDLQEDTQEFPDFLFEGDVFLELKTFDSKKSPAFDIANFASYIDSLLLKPQRLNSDYLVFSYKVVDREISIAEIWLKKVWELTGPSDENILALQVKRGQPYNIRPKSGFRQGRGIFTSRREFVEALWLAGLRFGTPASCNQDWFKTVTTRFEAITGKKL